MAMKAGDKFLMRELDEGTNASETLRTLSSRPGVKRGPGTMTIESVLVELHNEQHKSFRGIARDQNRRLLEERKPAEGREISPDILTGVGKSSGRPEVHNLEFTGKRNEIVCYANSICQESIGQPMLFLDAMTYCKALPYLINVDNCC